MTRRYIKNARLNRKHGNTYKLYVNSENEEEFWKGVEFVKFIKNVPSNYIAKAFIEKYHYDLLKIPLFYEEKDRIEKEERKKLEQIKNHTRKNIGKHSRLLSYQDRTTEILEDIKAYQPDLIISNKPSKPYVRPPPLTEEEKEIQETSDKIASGEWVVVTDEDIANMDEETLREYKNI